MSFEIPSNDPVAGDDGLFTRTWAQWLSRVHEVIQSVQQSGPTSERPVKVLWVGRRFFDTTLGKPVYFKSARPDVWVDANGVPV